MAVVGPAITDAKRRARHRLKKDTDALGKIGLVHDCNRIKKRCVPHLKRSHQPGGRRISIMFRSYAAQFALEARSGLSGCSIASGYEKEGL